MWGDGQQTRSFLYVDECVEAVLKLMESDFIGPVNIGSEEMVTINQLAQIAIDISGKSITIKNLDGEDFLNKYGFKCPIGVRGRNSDNKLFKEKVGWESKSKLLEGMKKTYQWINEQVQKEQDETSTVNSELIDEVQDEIAFTEQVIEPKPKVKKIVKKAKKSTVIAETK